MNDRISVFQTKRVEQINFNLMRIRPEKKMVTDPSLDDFFEI